MMGPQSAMVMCRQPGCAGTNEHRGTVWCECHYGHCYCACMHDCRMSSRETHAVVKHRRDVQGVCCFAKCTVCWCWGTLCQEPQHTGYSLLLLVGPAVQLVTQFDDQEAVHDTWLH
jgi:hypothetical protein